MKDFLVRALEHERSKTSVRDRLKLLSLAEKALEFGFLKNSCFVSDDEFRAFIKAYGVPRDDVRAIVHGLERLNNCDPYSPRPNFFID